MDREHLFGNKQPQHLPQQQRQSSRNATQLALGAKYVRRTSDFLDGAPNINHSGRLTLLGFVIGNGGNVHELKLFLADRGMLREPSSWADLSTIERALKGDPAFRESSYYWDINHNCFCNLTGNRKDMSVP